MCVYAMLCSISQGKTGVLTAMAIGTATYLLSLYLYFGIARLVYLEQNYLLLTAVVASIAIVSVGSGVARMVPGLIACGTVLVAGTAVGRLTRVGVPQQKVYLAGLLIVAVFAVWQFQPLWKPIMTEAPYFVDEQLEKQVAAAVSMGYGADALRSSAESARNLMAGVIRLIPVMTVLSAVMTFTLGYLIFGFVVGNETYNRIRVAPFAHWKMPLWLMPVFMAVIVTRLLGSGTLVLAADNIIAFMAFYYAITGLALAEFFMRKFHFTRFMRVMLYIMLLFTHLYGMILTALLGFIDSYADWRKIQQLSLARQ